MSVFELSRNSVHPQGAAFARDFGVMNMPSLFPAGAEIYAQGEKSGNLYKVEFGAVRIYRLLADGRRQISAFHLPGEVFGFEADRTHHFFADAVGATGISILRANASGGDAASELLPLALLSLVRAQEHLLVLGRQNATERIAAFLTDMSARQGGLRQIDLPMSRADIADYLGLTIETVSRVFSKLKQRGIIKLASLRRIEIARWQTLHEMAA
ncbi:transcriptional regulator [Mesorhizobium sp. L-8-10]|uniref:helix-turn-helix domain-containing protein n=1 Tax=unclassified Mesorhizobium TaxID=325217 RepID=UPI001927AB90|nr:transcriptional regulator [Mesorhizobium sp. L-8-3]BCH31957.1 transcriptional regulator [Mesorhizobium sp. L-8-10]